MEGIDLSESLGCQAIWHITYQKYYILSCEKKSFDLVGIGYYIKFRSNVEFQRVFTAFLDIFKKIFPPKKAEAKSSFNIKIKKINF